MNRGLRIAIAAGTVVLQTLLIGGVAVAADGPTDGWVPRVERSDGDADPWAVVSEPNQSAVDGWAYNPNGDDSSPGRPISFAAADASAGYMPSISGNADGWVAASTIDVEAPSFAMVDNAAGFALTTSDQPIVASGTDLTEYVIVGLLFLLLGVAIGGATVYTVDHRRTPITH
jgi:hypothetical protein